MVFFGPISSQFHILTFAVMLGVFHAGAPRFRAGWFAESLATKTLVIFAIRTRRTPFMRSQPRRPLLVAALTTVVPADASVSSASSAASNTRDVNAVSNPPGPVNEIPSSRALRDQLFRQGVQARRRRP